MLRLHEIRSQDWGKVQLIWSTTPLSSNRDEAAAKAFLNKAIAQYGLPEKVVIDGSKSNYAAIDAMNIQLWLTGIFMLSLIEILDIKYLNNIVEQSHRWVK